MLLSSLWTAAFSPPSESISRKRSETAEERARERVYMTSITGFINVKPKHTSTEASEEFHCNVKAGVVC